MAIVQDTILNIAILGHRLFYYAKNLFFSLIYVFGFSNSGKFLKFVFPWLPDVLSLYVWFFWLLYTPDNFFIRDYKQYTFGLDVCFWDSVVPNKRVNNNNDFIELTDPNNRTNNIIFANNVSHLESKEHIIISHDEVETSVADNWQGQLEFLKFGYSENLQDNIKNEVAKMAAKN